LRNWAQLVIGNFNSKHPYTEKGLFDRSQTSTPQTNISAAETCNHFSTAVLFRGMNLLLRVAVLMGILNSY